MGKLSKLKKAQQAEAARIAALEAQLRIKKQTHKNPLYPLEVLKNNNVDNFGFPDGFNRVSQITNRYSWAVPKDFSEEDADRFIKLTEYLLKQRASRMLSTFEQVDKLLRVALHYAKTIRPIEEWRPKGKNPRRNWQSLLRHLFAKYSLPLFMDKAWEGDYKAEEIEVYIQVAQGANLRKVVAEPLPLNKKMAHFALQAPSHYNYNEAAWRGLILSLNGSKVLVKAWLKLLPLVEKEEFAFWQNAFAFLVNYPFANTKQAKRVIRYIQAQKFGARQKVDYYVAKQAAENPDFSLKGRSFKQLLQLVKDYEARQNARYISWKGSAIPDFEWKNGKQEKGYEIRQLFNTKEIIAEGQIMRNCVATYTRECVEGTSSIWTMRHWQGECEKPCLTIELEVQEGGKEVVIQALGKTNRRAKPQEMQVVRRWAKENGLEINLE